MNVRQRASYGIIDAARIPELVKTIIAKGVCQELHELRMKIEEDLGDGASRVEEILRETLDESVEKADCKPEPENPDIELYEVTGEVMSYEFSLDIDLIAKETVSRLKRKPEYTYEWIDDQGNRFVLFTTDQFDDEDRKGFVLVKQSSHAMLCHRSNDKYDGHYPGNLERPTEDWGDGIVALAVPPRYGLDSTGLMLIDERGNLTGVQERKAAA